MLRIKENVDLKKLKNYGFKTFDICYEFELINRDENSESQEVVIIVYKEDFRKYKKRDLYLYVNDVPTDEIYYLDILFDMIKDGIVERC